MTNCDFKLRLSTIRAGLCRAVIVEWLSDNGRRADVRRVLATRSNDDLAAEFMEGKLSSEPEKDARLQRARRVWLDKRNITRDDIIAALDHIRANFNVFFPRYSGAAYNNER
jgi:hypothetical protein